MKILLIGWFGAGNIGDEAILRTELLFLGDRFQQAQFYILSFDPDKTKRLTADIPEVRKIFRVGSKKNFIKSDLIGIWKAFKEVDVVIIGGGGLFQDIYNRYPIPFFTAMILLARLNRKRSIFCSVGIGPITTSIGRTLCRWAASSIDLITVRDSESRDLLQGLGIAKPIYLSADPVFLLEPVRSHKVREIIQSYRLDKNGPVVGVCVHTLLPCDKTSWAVLADTLDTVVAEVGAQIVFLPFGVYRDGWFVKRSDDTVDVTASKRVAGLMREKSIVITDLLGPQEVAALMEIMDLAISMRLHGLIMALSRGIPVIALTYREETKVQNLMKRIDQENNLFAVHALGKSELLERIVAELGEKNSKKQLKEQISYIRAEAQRCNELIFEALAT